MNDPQPVGEATWADGHIQAELLDSGRWRVTELGEDDPWQAEALAVIYRDAYRGPSDGAFGHAILEDLAAWMGGTFECRQPPPDPPGVVY